MTERHTRILDIVSEEKRVEVNRLSERLGVSQVTIRKDLDMLEARGLLSREHGYAVMKNPDDIHNRMAVRYEIKRQIANAAAECVENGETVMVSSGSCCALLAERLVQEKDVTLITNSAFIASHVKDAPEGRVILLGGVYQKESQVMVGPMVRQCASGFHVDKLFIGADGYIPHVGFTGGDMMRMEAVRSMAQSARNLIIVTDSAKFGVQGVVVQAALSELSAVYTDKGILQEALCDMEEQGVEVHLTR